MVIFPDNPVDGQEVFDLSPDGLTVTVWTYNAANNEWSYKVYGEGGSQPGVVKSNEVVLSRPITSKNSKQLPDGSGLLRQHEANELFINSDAELQKQLLDERMERVERDYELHKKIEEIDQYDDTQLKEDIAADQQRQDKALSDYKKQVEGEQAAQDGKISQVEDGLKALHDELEQLQEVVETGVWNYNEVSPARAGDFTHSAGTYTGTGVVSLAFNATDSGGSQHTFANVKADDYVELTNVDGSGFGLYLVSGTNGLQISCQQVKGSGAPVAGNGVSVRFFHAAGSNMDLVQLDGRYAAKNHSHSGYASSSHTHSEYASSSHTHSGYASSSHTHSGYASSSHNHNSSYVKGNYTISKDSYGNYYIQ